MRMLSAALEVIPRQPWYIRAASRPLRIIAIQREAPIAVEFISKVAQCLGAFIRIIDPLRIQIGALLSPSIQQLVQRWIAEYDASSPDALAGAARDIDGGAGA